MKSLLLSGVMLLALTAAQAQELKPLNSDSEPDRIDWVHPLFWCSWMEWMVTGRHIRWSFLEV